MYFPYLRGRQFELIALRELSEKNLIGKNILPIVEPIKPSSTLIKTMEQFSTSQKELAFIYNPQVGNFSHEFKSEKEEHKGKLLKVLKDSFIIGSCYMNKNVETLIKKLESSNVNKANILVINNNRDYLEDYTRIFGDDIPRFVLIPDESTFRRNTKNNKVLFDDKFEKQRRNTDYSECDDEFFSDDHLYYKDDNFIGFSDYSVVGSDFSEKGFAPYAVAIHIVYFDLNKMLRIKHFVSDSNDDTNDPAGKFYEALKKLIKWQENSQQQTYAMEQFIEHYKNGTYPGLGTVKKLAIMHHIQLMNDYLDNEV